MIFLHALLSSSIKTMLVRLQLGLCLLVFTTVIASGVIEKPVPDAGNASCCLISFDNKTDCCTTASVILPTTVVRYARPLYESGCVGYILLETNVGALVCVPATAWSERLTCSIQYEVNARWSVFQTLKGAFETLSFEKSLTDTTTIKLSNLTTFDLMHTVAVLQSITFETREYGYQVLDGDHWLDCVCRIELTADAKPFDGTNSPSERGTSNKNIAPSATLAYVRYTVSFTFSSRDGKTSTKCTHNLIYSDDIFSASSE